MRKPMKKPVHGQGFGCTDTAPPETHSAAELSRVADLLHAADQIGTDLGDKVFGLLPSKMRMEFNYASWKYQAPLTSSVN